MPADPEEPTPDPHGSADAVARFAALVEAGDPPLDRAALEVARLARPDADVDAALAELDRLATGIGGIDELVVRLFTEEGFRGNRDEYYDPRNSSLVEVLERRLGIPITLAVVVIEVGRRAGLTVEPIGMPGHFLVHPAGSAWYVDPFTGTLLDEADCRALFVASTGANPGIPFHADLLAPITTEAVLVRMLTNLRIVHRAAGRVPELRRVLEARLHLPGVTADEVVELAATMGHRGEYLDAARLLDTWRERIPRRGADLARAARVWRAHLN
ncbi:SirB1 family protein [Actinomycetospora termitidis]|uniref:Transglutaminase-like domain-containing protein n=1 Tax=Actinomycetospora termitidis TaxID=3053470 RepID=A0ABT7M2U8_9PSEU|nr:transglutaminase-like domain-containing protein [Actinomycetospora sp. Odt1-22]MDL5154989.1 transglutaminase-like domain-containing protein [Actinomycetospora sp. Odt1-22]